MSIEVRAKQYGTVFGDWKFDERIGRGSEGKTAVFRLKRSHFDWHEEGALKVIPVIEESGKWELLSDSFKKDYEKRKRELCKKAEEEVRIMYKIHESAYVVNYLDFTFHDWKDGNSFGCDMLIRMELLENLRDQMKCRTAYTEKEIIQIGKDICKALISCHKENIIHRDIKPENIFKNKQGEYKLGDFGISRIVNRSQSANTKTGTEAYAAPEQFGQSSRGEYDYRVDIYSLGLILYELSNENRLPFATSAFAREGDIQLRIMGKTLEKPSNASQMFVDVILKACAYQPERRYQSAQDFLRDLNNVEDRIDNKETKEVFQSIHNQTDGLYETIPANASLGSYETVPAATGEEAEYEAESKIKSRVSKKTVFESVLEKIEDNILGILSNNQNRQNIERFRRIQKKAKCGDVDAQTNLGNCYYEGRGIKQSYEESIKWYVKAAKQGEMCAQCNLGNCYYNGLGVKQNYKEAVRWYRKAAEQGEMSAQYSLGYCYYYGQGVEQNYEEAVRWYRKAAQQGNSWAQDTLGNCYQHGQGVEQNYDEAIRWYRKAVEQGNLNAQNNLGACYESGYGYYEEAIRWYRQAAQQGNRWAQNNLGNCYYSGRGVEHNYREAVRWYKKAAEQGEMSAQYNLGICYYYGYGVEQNYKEAKKWYEKAAEQGNEGAQNMLKGWKF